MPGSGYLKFGTDEMVRFKAAYVSGVYRSDAGQATTPGGPLPVDRRPVLFTAAEVPVRYTAAAVPEPRTATAPDTDDALADTVIDVIVRRLEAQGPAAHQVWLPPLDSPPPLDSLLTGLTAVEGRGLTQSPATKGRDVSSYRSASSTSRTNSGATPCGATSPGRPVTCRSSADPSPGNRPCCAR